MGKKIILLSMLVFVAFTFQANAQQYLTTLKQQAEKMAHATLNSDYATLVKFMHPNAVKAMGGATKTINTVKQGMEMLKAQGGEFEKVTIGKVGQCIVGKTNIQCTVPQLIDIKMAGAKIHSNSQLFAISYNGGKDWYFLDAGNGNEAKIRKLIPEMSPKLIIPKTQNAFN